MQAQFIPRLLGSAVPDILATIDNYAGWQVAPDWRVVVPIVLLSTLKSEWFE